MRSDPTSWKVVVTGGSSGLGASVCRLLDKAGATVTSLDVRPGDDVETIQVDLSDTDAAESATRRAGDRMGGIDAVVCCAGIDAPGRLDAIGRESWDRIIGVNLLGTAAVVRAALSSLIERQGRIVTVSSTLGHRAVSDASAYCASKFGVVGLTRALAAELKGQVGVSLLTPGGMETAFFDGRDPQYAPGPDAALAPPDEVAEAVLWVLSRPEGIDVKEIAVMAAAEGSWP